MSAFKDNREKGMLRIALMQQTKRTENAERKLAKIRAVLPNLPDCRKHPDIGGMIECFVLLEPEPCWSCRIRGALAGIEPPVDLHPEPS